MMPVMASRRSAAPRNSRRSLRLRMLMGACTPRSHAPRGNASLAALRRGGRRADEALGAGAEHIRRRASELVFPRGAWEQGVSPRDLLRRRGMLVDVHVRHVARAQ